MDNELGIVGRLLDGVGRMSGHEFRLVPCGETPDDGPCGVPVSTGEGTRLLVSYPRENSLSSDDRQKHLLHVLGCAKQLIEEREESTSETRQVTEELNQAYEELHLFSRIATQIRSLQFSRQMLRDLLQEIREAMRVDMAAALFPDDPQSTVEVVSSDVGSFVPDTGPFLDRLIAEIPRSAPGFEGNCFIVSCSSELPCFACMHDMPFRALAIRISHVEQRHGWLLLVSFNMKEIFRRGEYRLLSTMAEQIALVKSNTALYKDLELFVINLVKSMVMAIEAKDEYTKGHSERVNGLCMDMAEGLELSAGQRANLQWSSTLHDLGKIGTPEGILNKPGRLSDTEFDCIKEHPVRGAEILKPISQLAEALPVIRHHHERYDGTGYPDGLQGESIPLLARIIAVADTYDAITSSRAYRAARSDHEALRIIEECAGTQFDPRVVEVFLRTVKRHEEGSGSTSPETRPLNRRKTE